MLPCLSEESGEESFKDKVVVIMVGEKDLVNKQSFKFWRKTLQRVNEEGAKAVILDLDTPGGLALDTKDLMIDELWDLEVPSYSFVNDDAISAGALISIATDEIWLTPKSKIGAAAIVNGTGAEIEETMRAKIESYFDATVRTVAEEKGHNAEVVKMMMFRDDKKRRLGPIQVDAGKLLTLNAKDAMKQFKGETILGKGIVNDREELIEKLGFSPDEVVEAQQSGFEKLAWYVAAFSPLLILVGMGGVYFEMKAPGFGLGGGVALLAFGTFFFGNFVAGNLAGYELAGVFVLGVIFLVIEFFIFPTVILGVLGGVMMVGSLLFAMVDRFDFQDMQGDRLIEADRVSFLDIITTPLMYLSLGLLGGIILIFLLMKYLPYIPLSGILLKRAIGDKAAKSSEEVEDEKEAEELIGKEGVAVMDLRPVGKVEVDGVPLDVITRGEFLPKGTRVRIVVKEQMRTIVEEV